LNPLVVLDREGVPSDGRSAVPTTTPIRLSEIGAGLFHFIFETLVSLFEKPTFNELQEEPQTMSAEEERNRKK
jgi:hypothetical protein